MIRPELSRQIEDYIAEFNALNETERLMEDPINIYFVSSVKKQPVSGELDDFRPYLASFFNSLEQGTDINPFLLGWTKEIVDGVFKMDEIRPTVNYDSFLHVLLYFEDANSFSVVGSLYVKWLENNNEHTLTIMVQELVNKSQEIFHLISDLGVYTNYRPQDFRFITNEDKSYDKKPTELYLSFWEAILSHATLDELQAFYEVNDPILDGLILAARDANFPFRKNNFIVL